MSDRRLIAVAVAAAAAMLLAGCANIPTSGAVHVGRPLSAVGGLGDVDVRVQPPQAQPGMSANDVVRGFLRAVVNSDGDYEIARSYLTDKASQTWKTAGITTYDDGSAQIATTGGAARSRVDLQVARRGFVDARGEFSPQAGRLRTSFRLVRQHREWRIDQLHDGVLLSTSDAQRSLRLATLYYVDRTHRWLVPQQLLIRPQAVGFTTAMVRSLLAGPGPWLAPAVRTGFPRGVSLIGNVAVGQTGTAEVNLSSAVRQATGSQLRELAAQLVWTLSQDSQITSVRLLADSSPLNVPDAPAVQTRRTWADFTPAPPVQIPAFFAGAGGWRSTAGGSNPSLQSAAGLSHLAMTTDGRVLAAIAGRPGRVRLLTWHSGGRPETRLSARTLTPPATDRNGNVFVVAGDGRHADVTAVTPSGDRLRVAAPGLASVAVRELSISPDGSRVAAVVGPAGRGRLLVGRVAGTGTTLTFD